MIEFGGIRSQSLGFYCDFVAYNQTILLKYNGRGSMATKAILHKKEKSVSTCVAVSVGAGPFSILNGWTEATITMKK